MVKVPKIEEQDISKFVNKLVFLVCSPEDNEATDEFFITTIWADLITHLNSMEIDADKIPRVLHGLLTYAEFLPDDTEGETAYLVAEDPDDSESILVSSGFSGNDVIKKLTDQIDEAIGEENSHYIMSRKELTIDNLFVLYGHALEVTLSVNKDSMDEASIDNCMKLRTEIQAIENAVEKKQPQVKQKAMETD